MIFRIKHKTVFKYNNPPLSAIQKLRLTPRNEKNQKILNWDIDVKGCSIELETYDYQGNKVHLCKTKDDAREITITCSGRLNINDSKGIVGEHDDKVPLDLFKYSSSNYTKPGSGIKKILSNIKRETNKIKSDIEILNYLSNYILKLVKYSKGKTSIKTSCEDAIKIGFGVCQDHVHIFLSCVRELGFPGRYISGYLMLDDTKIQEASHAWAEVYIKHLGWVGFDISNSISPDNRYVKLAVGFDYSDVIPISGIRVGNSDEKINTKIIIESKQ